MPETPVRKSKRPASGITLSANSEPVESAAQQLMTGISRPTEANGSSVCLRKVFPNLGQAIPHHRSQSLQIAKRLAERFDVFCGRESAFRLQDDSLQPMQL